MMSQFWYLKALHQAEHLHKVTSTKIMEVCGLQGCHGGQIPNALRARNEPTVYLDHPRWAL